MLSSVVKDKVKDFIGKGQKMAALKYLRKQYPLSLQEARDWVEYLGGRITAKPPPFSEAPTLTIIAKEKVKSMVQKGESIQAIKYLKEEFQLSLQQAKELVDLASHEVGVSQSFSVRGTAIPMYLFALSGTVFFAVALHFFWKDYLITHDSITVTGLVIELQYDHSDQSSAAIPVVQYTWKGMTKVHYGSTYSSPPVVEVGEKVKVIISRTEPDKVVLDLISERYLLIFIFGILGFVFGAIGYIGIFYTGRST
jgi:ribosomal protein L7/L12